MKRRSGRDGERRTSWTQWFIVASARASSGMYRSTIPSFATRQVSPPSSVSQTPTAEIATSNRFGSPGQGTIVWRQRPPLPGCQSPREGCSQSPRLSSHVSPPSVLLKSGPGSPPA